MQRSNFKDKNLRYFKEEDPFNPNNVLEGYVSQADHGIGAYGALIIENVFDKNTNKRLGLEQVIPATPKLKYPFSKEGNWTFPSADEEILRYIKYDGTNVYMYRYQSPSGMKISYKTRGLPFMRDDFKEMWDTILDKRPSIPHLFGLDPGLGLTGFSFEMYGFMNPHCIVYNEPISAKILFARRGDDIVPIWDIRCGDVPFADFLGTVDADYVWNYQEAQKDLEERLEKVEDGGLIGDEGEIWYLKDKYDGKWKMYKCKPPTILQEHWSNTTVLKSVIRATAQNSLEEVEESNVDIVKRLLLEEFTEEQVERSERRIKQIVIEVNAENVRHKKIKEHLSGMDYMNMELPQIMRAIHHNFSKSDIRHVGSYVKRLLGDV